jgi:hypothetical protein
MYNSEELPPLATSYLASGYSEMAVLFLHLLPASKLMCGEGTQIQAVETAGMWPLFSIKALFDLFQVK